MKSFSSAVISSQLGPHEHLPAIWARRQTSVDQTPIAAHSVAAWELSAPWFLARSERILDLGCGTGDSTQRLAHRYPEAHVLGVDRSADRLGKDLVLPDNARRIRADQYDVLRLLSLAGAKLSKVYLLYPNPSPKPWHLLRRWQAHPILPTLLDCTQNIELRTNWAIYAEEFAATLAHFGWQEKRQCLATQVTPISPFEAKYQASGHALWQVLGQKA